MKAIMPTGVEIEGTVRQHAHGRKVDGFVMEAKDFREMAEIAVNTPFRFFAIMEDIQRRFQGDNIGETS